MTPEQIAIAVVENLNLHCTDHVPHEDCEECVLQLQPLLDALTAERQKVAVLRDALTVIHKTVRGDEKSECWTIRAYMDQQGLFNGDIGSSYRLVELVCSHALGLTAETPKEPR